MIETRQILEELQLKNVLATSPTGAIFLAGDPETGKDVVIKMVSCAVPSAEEKVRQLFLAMVEAARSEDILAMPSLTDHGLTPEGDGFVVMDLVEGRSLDTFDDLSTFAAVNILLDVLSCIEDLERAGTAHLNLKPTNICVTNAPSYDRAVVLGFGTSATLLHAGAGVPVPAIDPHLAPELVSGEVLPSDQSWRSDLFSFGVIACGALGAEIEANGYDRPRVSLPPAVRAAMPEAEPLENTLGRIMAPDPMVRGDVPSDVRDPLIRALPDPPVAGVTPEIDPLPSAPGSYDPNKTDPAFDPTSTTVTSRPAPTTDAPISGDLAANEVVVMGTDADGWPEVLFDDPELPASLDDAEDTDVRNPIPEDVWVPRTGGTGATVDAPAAIPPASNTTAAVRRVSRTELALVATVVVVLGSIVAFTWPTGGDDDALALAAATHIEEQGSTESLVPPPPDDNLFDDLLAVQRLVDAGDLEAARAALEDLDGRDGFSMSSDESALFDSLVTAVARAADHGAAISDLRTGLGYGSVKMVQRGAAGLAGMPRAEIEEINGLAGDLERARTVLRLHEEMWDAHREGDHLRAIRRSADLEHALPGYSGAPEVREQSAAAVEARAEALVAAHEYENAIASLEMLHQVWPHRDGLSARIARCREQLDRTQRGESVIAAALAMGEGGDPEGGLARLDTVTPDPRLADEIDRARSTLEARLASLDAGEPTIELAGEQELAFKKNSTITVPIAVTDDYRIERVVVHARNEADDGFLQIPLQADGDGLYRFEVSPELHGNKNVYFFVVARDRSGHVGHLGSQEAPQTITRKKWYKKLL